MKATLKLELFGDNSAQYVKLFSAVVDNIFVEGVGGVVFGERPSFVWVAQVVGLTDKNRLLLHQLRGKKDYSQANSVGSRGVFMWYVLESGNYYKVSERVSWKCVDDYFVKVLPEGEIMRVNRLEVERWAKSL